MPSCFLMVSLDLIFYGGVLHVIVTRIVFNVSVPPTCVNCSAALPIGESPPFFENEIAHLSEFGLHKPDAVLFPTQGVSSLSLKPRISLLPPSPRFISLTRKWRSEPTLLSPSDSSRRFANCSTFFVILSDQGFGKDEFRIFLGHHYCCLGFVSPSVLKYYFSCPIGFIAHYLWGNLVFLTNFLKITSGFTGVFTETDLHIKLHLSCSKSSIFSHLPVGSPGPSLSSCFSYGKQTIPSITSLLRSVFPPFLWRCISISITVLLFYGAVCLGPEDTVDFVSTRFRGADWMSTSQFKVTIPQLSDYVVKAILTHSSPVLFSPSSSFEDLSSLSYSIVVYICGQRGWIIPSSICNQAS